MKEFLEIRPFEKTISATATLPGSKSITNRALIFAVLSTGTVRLTGALFSRDTNIMIAALHELGFRVEADEPAKTITVEGLSGKIPNARAKIFVGNAGTVARFLTALLVLHPDGEYILDGDPAMRTRPMGGLVRALVSQGATATGADGKSTESFPFTLRTRGFHTHKLSERKIVVDAAESSQMLSALLMIAPYIAPTSIRLAGKTVSEPFVKMTQRMCKLFHQGPFSQKNSAFFFKSRGEYSCLSGGFEIEPDATAASYFLALPIAVPATIRINGLSSNSDSLQGDVEFTKYLRDLGLRFRDTKNGWEVSSPVKQPARRDFDFNSISDTFLTLAALVPLLKLPVTKSITIRGIAHARKQETDRVLAMATELEKLGQRVEPPAAELKMHPEIGYITIHPNPEKMRALTAQTPATIHTYEDHRMAMSFGILGSHDLHGDGRVWLQIEDPACCGKTFPNFFEVLESMRNS